MLTLIQLFPRIKACYSLYMDIIQTKTNPWQDFTESGLLHCYQYKIVKFLLQFTVDNNNTYANAILIVKPSFWISSTYCVFNSIRKTFLSCGSSCPTWSSNVTHEMKPAWISATIKKSIFSATFHVMKCGLI